MAKRAASGIRAYLDHYPLSGYINAASFDLTQELPDVTCFSDAGPRRIPANYMHAGAGGGFFDSASATALDTFLEALAADGADHYLLQCFAGDAAGSPCYEQVVQLGDRSRKGQGGGAVLLDYAGEGSGQLSRSTVLFNGTTGSAGNQTGQDIGATTSGQLLVVVFRLLSIGSGSVTAKIQESSDDAAGDAYADVSGLTSGSLSAAGTVRVTTTAATEAWKRVVLSGTFTAAALLVTAGRAA